MSCLYSSVLTNIVHVRPMIDKRIQKPHKKRCLWETENTSHKTLK